MECDKCVNDRERITAGSAKLQVEETSYDGRTIIRIHLTRRLGRGGEG